MIVTCPKCSTRLQLEMGKLPARTFTIKCPKCQNLLSVSPSEAAGEEHLTNAPTTPLMAAEGKPPLAESKVPKPPPESSPTPADAGYEAIKALASMLTATLGQTAKPGGGEPSRRRRVLTCLSSEEDARKIRSLLPGTDYELTAVESSEQAVELLQLSNQVDLVLLDQSFEEDHQGCTAVLRFINALTPSRRRRLYIVLLSATSQTFDSQTAFINGVNLIINLADLNMLPLALSKGIREFNLLYRSYNEASGASPF